MRTKIVEAVQSKDHPGNWGKFLVGVPDTEWERGSEVCPGGALLSLCGWSAEHLWVMDLQTGEGAYFKPGGYAASDLERKHAIWVCVLFESFLEWLYDFWRENGGGILDLEKLPGVVELPDAPFAFYGHRRPGPPQFVRDLTAVPDDVLALAVEALSPEKRGRALGMAAGV